MGAAALGLPGLAAAMGLCHFLMALSGMTASPNNLFTTACMGNWWWLYVVPALIGLGLGVAGCSVAARSGPANVRWATRPALFWVAVSGLIVAAMLFAPLAGQ